MDESQRDEILWRLDERTARIDDRIDFVQEQVITNAEAIDDLDVRVKRNTGVLSIITFGISTITAAVVAKFATILQLLK